MTTSEKKQLMATACKVRMGAIKGVHAAKAGHPGGSLSAADLFTYLYFKELRIDPKNPKWEDRDRFVLSKGHTAPGLYAALCRRVPWPDVSRALPCNALPALPGTTAQAPFASLPDLPAGSLEGLRLGYVLFSLPWPDAVSLLRACALAARQLWLADFILAERNLGLPAALLRRLLPGFLPWGPATPARIWLRRGGLEGCLRDAGLAAAQRRTLLAGAAVLIQVAPVRLQATPRPARP